MNALHPLLTLGLAFLTFSCGGNMEHEGKTGSLSAPRQEVLFPVQDAEYVVTFESTPNINPFEAAADDGTVRRGLRAEFSGSDSFQRAEHFPMPAGFLTGLTAETVRQQLIVYALHNGMKAPEAHSDYPHGDITGRLRGTKLLFDESLNQKRAVTFEVYWYYGSSSILALYTGGPSETYPQAGVMRFLDSVRKIN